MNRYAFISVAVLLSNIPANATMPILPDRPSNITRKTCKEWATQAVKSDEEIRVMWGLQENGSSSNEVAIQRLIDNCLGKEMPQIVGFFSSVGVARDYCEANKKTKLCKKWGSENKK